MADFAQHRPSSDAARVVASPSWLCAAAPATHPQGCLGGRLGRAARRGPRRRRRTLRSGRVGAARCGRVDGIGAAPGRHTPGRKRGASSSVGHESHSGSEQVDGGCRRREKQVGLVRRPLLTNAPSAGWRDVAYRKGFCGDKPIRRDSVWTEAIARPQQGVGTTRFMPLATPIPQDHVLGRRSNKTKPNDGGWRTCPSADTCGANMQWNRHEAGP